MKSAAGRILLFLLTTVIFAIIVKTRPHVLAWHLQIFITISPSFKLKLNFYAYKQLLGL